MIKFVEVDGDQIEYEWSGNGSDNTSPIILLHEGLGSVSMWKDFPAQLAETTKHKVLTFSRRGYGRSSPCGVPRPVNFMHREALTFLPLFLKSMDIKNHYLYGHSDGGSISLIYAGGAEAPGLKGIITEAPHVICEQRIVDAIEQAAKNYKNGDLREKLKRYHLDNVDCAFEGWKSAWLNSDFLNWNIEKYLSKIDVPVLAIQGKEDQYGSFVQMELIKKGMCEKADLLELDDCGHSPHAEKTDAVLNAAKKFIFQVAQQKTIL